MGEDRLHEPYRTAHFPAAARARRGGRGPPVRAGRHCPVPARPCSPCATTPRWPKRSAAPWPRAAERLGLGRPRGRGPPGRPRRARARRGRAVTFPARLERFRARSTRPSAWCASGWPPGRPRWPSPSPTHQTARPRPTGPEWLAPPGAGLLLSVGFRPGEPGRRATPGAWRPSWRWRCAMRRRRQPGLPDGHAVAQVAQRPGRRGGGPRQGGACSRSAACWANRSMSGERVESAAVGHRHQQRLAGGRLPVGLWHAPMTSLHELSGGRPIDND